MPTVVRQVDGRNTVTVVFGPRSWIGEIYINRFFGGFYPARASKIAKWLSR